MYSSMCDLILSYSGQMGWLLAKVVKIKLWKLEGSSSFPRARQLLVVEVAFESNIHHF